MLPNLKAGVIVGVFKTKGATPWTAAPAAKLQVSMFLPNDQPIEEWFATVRVACCMARSLYDWV